MPILEIYGGLSNQTTTTAQSAINQAVHEQIMYQQQIHTPAMYLGTDSTFQSSASTNCYTTTTMISGESVGLVFNIGADRYEIDEEDYMNHAEYYELARQRGVHFHIRTAEEKRLRDEAIARQWAEAEQRERMRMEGRERARELLLSNLSSEQRSTFEKNKWFVVVGGKTKTKYRIRSDHGVSGNIQVMNKDKVEATLCCHCHYDIPDYDQFLAQKIALTWDEDNFLRIANRRAA